MDPYNNFYDFVEMAMGRKLNKNMVDNYEQVRAKLLNELHTVVTSDNITWTGAIACAPNWNVSLEPFPVQQECPAPKCKKEKGNNPMDDKVYYLKSRIEEIYCDFKNDFIKQFAVKTPSTFADLVTAIKNGTYTDNTATEGKRYNLFDGVKWGDQAGYEAAVKAMKSARQIALDTITVKDPATDGLAAMQTFEAWTYTAPAVSPTSESAA